MTSLRVFDSVTAAEDNMKSKLPGAQNNLPKTTSKAQNFQQERKTNGLEPSLNLNLTMINEDRSSGKKNNTEVKEKDPH